VSNELACSIFRRERHDKSEQEASPYLQRRAFIKSAAGAGAGALVASRPWVSYCNAPVGAESLADERAANGDKEPFRVKYWGVGNESWGCGGDMKPGEYATLYRQFVTQFPAYVAPMQIRGDELTVPMPANISNG
jgi:hypothetical protein